MISVRRSIDSEKSRIGVGGRNPGELPGVNFCLPWKNVSTCAMRRRAVP